MKIKLYPNFSHWYHGGTIFLFSDPHFCKSEQKVVDESWPDPDDLVKRINVHLSKNDTIIFLGDIGDVEYIKKIKGYKVLIMGNHDSGVSNYKKKYEVFYDFGNGMVNRKFIVDTLEEANELAEYLKVEHNKLDKPTIIDNKLFDEVYEGPLFISPKILLSHEPIKLDFGINIHGHCHSNKAYSVDIGNGNIRFNIAADKTNFNKVRLDELCNLNLAKIVDIHRIAINKQAKNKV